MRRSLWFALIGKSNSPTRSFRKKPNQRIPLLVESLEDRFAPATTNFAASVNGSTLVLSKTARGDAALVITAGTVFGQLTVTTTTGTINGSMATYTPPIPINNVSIVLGAGNDTVTLDGTTATGHGEIDLAGNVNISGTRGDKSITLQSMRLHAGNLNINLTGNGSETATFTDVDVGGTATINHPGTGNTAVTITTSGNPNTVNNWGSLSITNGPGADTNTINDTNFAGNVTISNGPGEAHNIGQNGGSITTFGALNDQTLATITGNLTVTTGTGQSDTELYDYSVQGNVSINTGAGYAGESNPNFVGLEDLQTFAGSGIPVIGGNVSITARTRESADPGLVIDLGTGTNPASLPLVIDGNLSIDATGSGVLEVNDTAGTVLGNATLMLQNSGDESVTFTDTSIQGATKISHPGSGNTNLTIASSGNPNALNNWGSLTVVNGRGADTNTINDTNFGGAVTISNGPGQPGNIGQYGGSFTTFAALNDKNLATISGNLVITTASGQSDTEIHDYNVQGNVTIDTGPGANHEANDNLVGIENVQTVAGSGIPVIGGNVKIIGSARGGIDPGLEIDLGTGTNPASLPLIIDGNLLVITKGSGTVNVNDTAGLVLGNATLAIRGTGDDALTFTDTSIRGATTVTHPGTGNTNLTITTSGSPNTQNSWGSLTVGNGAGADTNTINDTNFAGNVTINNGPGNPGDIGTNSGSLTVFGASHDPNPTTVAGSLTITTGSGQSDTEIHDYNVHGNVTINTGPGIAKEASANFVGLENADTLASNSSSGGTSSGSGSSTPTVPAVPMIGGNVTILGTSRSSVSPGLVIDLGTGTTPGDFPLLIGGNLTITAKGSGSVSASLNDVRVPVGTTSLSLGAQTSNDTVGVQAGTGLTSLFAAFTISSLAGGTNNFSIQDQAGETDFAGAVELQLGPGADTLNLAGDSGNPSGVTSALVKFFSTAMFDGGAGETNTLFEGAANTNTFATVNPKVVDF